MKQVIWILLLSGFAKGQSFNQLVMVSPACSTNDEVTLKGSTVTNGAHWVTEDAGARISNAISPTTNVSFTRYDDFHFKLVNRRNEVLQQQTVRAVHQSQLPIVNMATKLVPRLLTHQYQYLALGHLYFRSISYLPNVGRFFRSKVDKTSALMDKVVNYIRAKHVTTAALDGSNPPNYSCFLFDKPNYGLQSPLNTEERELPRNLKHAFAIAFKYERGVVGLLTELVHAAEQFEDYELVEFLSTELIPELTKSMKILSDHKKSVGRISKNNEGLGEFIFDREFN
uniref:Uncharacterized protein LOC100185827 n=1 Tax=Phallusia mammillata TaxID=59560 RepID=A0A6F9DIJ0_9ASCI|nr:uncharacterized protein LOC100185827 [Phallusia mammillata]